MNILMALPLLFVLPQRPEPIDLRLGPEGEILTWAVAGPFPNVGALQLKGTGFRADYLNPEAAASPRVGQVIPKTEFEAAQDPKLIDERKPMWQFAIADLRNGLDLRGFLKADKPGIAYCFAELISPIATDAQLLFGSDDGAKIWLNGTQIFEKQLARGVKRDEDRVAIKLDKGANRLLFKIEQGDGGWGLLARIVDLAGQPLPGLVQHQVLLPDQNSSSAANWVWQALGRPGTLDISEALSYERWKSEAGRWVKNFRMHAAQPEALENALSATIPPSSTADALSLDLASARKRIERAYHTSRKPFLERFQNPGPLHKTDVAKEDYARVMPGGRYFVHANGAPFIPIGYNHNPDWPKFVEAHGLEEKYDPALPEKYMAHLKSKGVNVLRLMIETPPSGNLEERMGVFRPEHVVWIDAVVAAARKHNVKLIVTPWDTFWMNLRWETTSYNPANGGKVQERIQFITSPEVRKQQKRRLQYMIDRWGNTGTIFSWEILNEGDLWWGANAAQLTEWATDIGGFVRSYEKGKWGRNHMVSFSFAEAMPKDQMADFAYDSKLFDYATTHLYIGVSKAPKEPIGPALAIQQGVNYALAQIDDNRPYMDTENGPIDKWIDDAKLDNEVFHTMSWAHLAAGGAGSGFRWPYRNPHHLTEGMLDTLRMMSDFTKAVDWKKLAGKHVPVTIAGDKGAATVGFATNRAALVWTSGSTAVKLNFPAKQARVFDCKTGKWSKVAITNQTIPLNPARSIAIIIER